MGKPSFFIVGMPKAGTTMLFELLTQHPEVGTPRLKEPGYFCTDFHQESDAFYQGQRFFPIRTKERYEALFPPGMTGEASPDYLYSQQAPANIRTYNRNAKIIILLRDPASFLPSYHAQMVRASGEAFSLRKALALEPARRKGKHMPKGVRWPSALYYMDKIALAGHLQRWFNTFATKQIKILFFDDFTKDNHGVYQEVLTFLGLPPYTPDYTRRPTRTPRSERIQHLINRISASRIKHLLPPLLRAHLIKLFNKLLLKPQKRAKDPALHAELQELCRSQVEDLGELLGVDLLKKWRYP